MTKKKTEKSARHPDDFRIGDRVHWRRGARVLSGYVSALYDNKTVPARVRSNGVSYKPCIDDYCAEPKVTRTLLCFPGDPDLELKPARPSAVAQVDAAVRRGETRRAKAPAEGSLPHDASPPLIAAAVVGAFPRATFHYSVRAKLKRDIADAIRVAQREQWERCQ